MGAILDWDVMAGIDYNIKQTFSAALDTELLHCLQH